MLEARTRPPSIGSEVAHRADVVTCADLHAIRDAIPDDATAVELPHEIEVSLGALCGRARDRGLRVEEMLVQVKRVWRELPGSPRFEAVTHRDARLDRIVSSLIERYFDEAYPHDSVSHLP